MVNGVGGEEGEVEESEEGVGIYRVSGLDLAQ